MASKILIMKTKIITISLLLIAFLSVFTACKKDKETEQPDYPQLIGTWQGNTWQTYPISISVINVEGQLYISAYQFAVTRIEGGFFDSVYYSVSNSAGIAPVVNKQFSLQLFNLASEGDSLWGTFDTGEMILAGDIKTVFESGTVTGNYSAVIK